MLHLEKRQIRGWENIVKYLKDLGVNGKTLFCGTSQIKYDRVHFLSCHLQTPTANGEKCVKWDREVSVKEGWIQSCHDGLKSL